MNPSHHSADTTPLTALDLNRKHKIQSNPKIAKINDQAPKKSRTNKDGGGFSTLHPDTLYDNKYKERSQDIQKENYHPNSNQSEKEQKRLEKIAKFNNSKLFSKKLPERESNTFTPFKLENSMKETSLQSSGLKENVLSKHFPVLEKNLQDALQTSNMELSSSQINRRVTVDPSIFAFNGLQPLDKRSSLNSPHSITFGQTPKGVFPDLSSFKASEVKPLFNESTLGISTQTEVLEKEVIQQVEPKKKEIPFSYVMITFVALILTGACFFSFRKESATIAFCNSSTISENGENCSPCPVNAICQNGGMECQQGFSFLNGACKENNEQLRTKEKYLGYLSNFLKTRRGDHLCGDNVDYTLSGYQLEKVIQMRYGQDALYKETYGLLEQDFKNAELGNIDNLVEYGITINSETKRFYSEQAEFSLQCKAKNYLAENMLLVVIAIIVISVIIKNYGKYQDKKNDNKLAQRIYSEIVLELNRIKKACVKELYARAEEKYGEYTVEELWPQVEKLRVRYGRVLLFKDEYNGNYEYFWGL